MPSSCLKLSGLSRIKSMFCIVFFAANLTFICRANSSSNIFSCANTSLTTGSGKLLSHPPNNELSSANTSVACYYFISILNATSIEISFQEFITESVFEANLLNDMCTFDFLEIVTFDQTWRICGNWQGKEHLLFFIFHTSTLEIKFKSRGRHQTSRFAMQWEATHASQGFVSDLCASPLHETPTSCFELISEPANWVDGHNACRRRGASLAVIDNEAVHNDLATKLLERNTSLTSVWIGAHDRLFEGDYMWTDRSTVNFQNWFPGWSSESTTHVTRQPSDDGYSNEDCVEIRRVFTFPEKGQGFTDTFFWNDRNCDEKNPFICEHSKIIEKRSVSKQPFHCSLIHNLTTEKPSVRVTSPNFPASYPKLTSCNYIITAPFGKQITLDFLHMNLEDGKQCEYDNVTISQSPGKNASHGKPICGNWNDNVKLLRWTSEMNAIKISFNSDNSKQFSGFEINASVVYKSVICETALEAVASSAFGPTGCWYALNASLTDDNDDCALIGASPAQDQVLEYPNFIGQLIGLDNGCSTVSGVRRQNTTETTHTPADDFCDAIRVCRYDVNGVVPTFSAAEVNVPCSDIIQIICKRNITESPGSYEEVTVNSSSGTINKYCPDGNRYDNNEFIVWNFVAPEGDRFLFEVHRYEIEYQRDCLYDFILTSGMVEDRRLCGASSTTMITKKNYASLTFKSDEDIVTCGFNFSWYLVPENVSIELQMPDLESGKSGFVKSINFPGAFPDIVDQCVDISAPDGERIVLELTNLELPGDGCHDAILSFTSPFLSTWNKRFCGGSSLTHINNVDRFFVSDDEQLTICLKAQRLEIKQGFHATFAFEKRNMTYFRDTISIEPGERLNVSSLFYPRWFPAGLTQELKLTTSLGSNTAIEAIHVSFRNVNGEECAGDTVEIIDTSLSTRGELLASYSDCERQTDTIHSRSEETFSLVSVLNSLNLVISSGFHGNTYSNIQLHGIISSGMDKQFLNKTTKLTGSFDTCFEGICKNGGNCTETDDGRYACACHPRYTGLFCQVTQCERSPCKHGVCHLTDGGYRCACDVSHFGSRCEMDALLCQYRHCSGNGHCLWYNESSVTCLCGRSFTGSSCQTPIFLDNDDLTIGQKLLKEPIWIGMIVVLNLLFLICVTYVIRRKCGRRIANLFPKPRRQTAKEDSKTTVSPGAMNNDSRSLYSFHLDAPTTSSGLPCSPSVTISKINRDRELTSPPRTPVIDDDNKFAALKLFAAYNAKKEHISPTISSIQKGHENDSSHLIVANVIGCGIQGGSVRFNPDMSDVEADFVEKPHGILRSYTISSEIRSSRTRRKMFEQEERRASSYAGSPINTPILDIKRLQQPQQSDNLSTSNSGHCFPVIKIINENNVEECRISDSDGSAAKLSNIACDHDDRQQKQKPPETADSGYPSTTTLSNTTNSSSKVCDIKQVTLNPTAADKRKLYSSKAKSASFYNIDTHDDDRHPANNSIDSTVSNRKQFQRFMHSSKYDSIESDICRSCEREKVDRLAFSYESDLDKLGRMRRRSCTNDSQGNTSRHRHSRHNHRFSASRYHRQFVREPIHLHSRHHYHSKYHSNLSKTSYTDRCDMRNNRYRYHSAHKNTFSSSDSEPIVCIHHQDHKRKRRHYRSKGSFFSENDYHHCRKIENSDEFSVINYEETSLKQQSYKTKQMHSFLKDAYKAKYQNCHDNMCFVGDCKQLSTNNLYSSSVSYPNESPQRSRSRSTSPRQYSYSHKPHELNDSRVDAGISMNSISETRNLPTNERRSRSFRYQQQGNRVLRAGKDPCKVRIGEYNGVDIENESDHSLASDRIVSNTDESTYVFSEKDSSKSGSLKNRTYDLKQKDSAYQTKQSSVDRYKDDKLLISSTGSFKYRPEYSTDNGTSTRLDDRTQNHLKQAALKLTLIKRLQQNSITFSKDSAVHTFSEDDLSADDVDTRLSTRPGSSKRSGGGLMAFQFGEMSLSEVKEEMSGLSRETDNYNTPTNEPAAECAFEHPHQIDGGLPLNDLARTDTHYVTEVISKMEETNV